MKMLDQEIKTIAAIILSRLNERGAELGNASIPIIEDAIASWHTIDVIQLNNRTDHCAQCGELTDWYSLTFDWYICDKHNSFLVLGSTANHVMNPND